jgi:hypothetical protein
MTNPKCSVCRLPISADCEYNDQCPHNPVTHDIKKEMKIEHPNPKKHLYISLIKSVIRIIAGSMLFVDMLHLAGLLIIVAELLGIAEELV